GGATGDIILRVNNLPDVPPATTSISASGRTLAGQSFPTGTSFVDIDQAGNFSFLANNNALYIADASTSNPRILSAVNFKGPLLDILANPAGTGVFVLERGQLENQEFRDRLWFIDVTNPSNPVVNFKERLRDAKRLILLGDRVQSFYPSQ